MKTKQEENLNMMEIAYGDFLREYPVLRLAKLKMLQKHLLNLFKLTPSKTISSLQLLTGSSISLNNIAFDIGNEIQDIHNYLRSK